mgnify:CR=1 FL=1|jgi:hypothetical protein
MAKALRLFLFVSAAYAVDNATLLKMFSQKLHNMPENKDLMQLGSEIHTDRPPDETLVDTLTMMKTMLAQAQS